MSDDFVPGQRIGDYEILGELGAGGMGKVYKVRNTISDRIEAMKVLLANLAAQKELADRFLREIKLLASLDHPNIAKLNTALTLDNQLVMMMEYVDGVTLASRLLQGPIAAADAANYSDQVISALGYAHKLNVIHRDVKPANMMLTSQGVVKLMDFGIARPNDEAGMTSTGATLGSMNYMSPEQVRCEPVDQRSDLYSMGVSLYEMVTGKLPFRGHSNYSVMSAHLQEMPKPPIAVRPDLPKGLSDIILMAMAKDPRERFQSAEAFGAALRSVFPAAAGAVSPIPAPVRVPQETPAASAARIPAETAPAMAVVAAAESQAATRSGHRGAYMALGGILVVGMLFAAGFYVPRVIKTHAGSRAAAPQSDAQPIAQPAAPPVDVGTPGPAAGEAAGAAEVPAVPAPAATLPASTALATPAAAPAAAAPPAGAHARADSASAKASQQAEQQANQEAEQKANEEAERKAAELKDAERQFDQVASRAAAISDGLDTLRRAQAAQGYGLRGDIATAEQLMKTDLGRAQDALQQQDGAKAKEYLDEAEVQASIIERFQGR
ncbi:MAG TPA: protein kinase [Candidatus Acidoferrales bacterium]|nr:protein kinase [Candidatus Acidoferrales bacterium]